MLELRDWLALISPTVVVMAAVFATARWFWHRFEAAINEGRTITYGKLDKIDSRIEQMAACLTAHDRQLARLEGMMAFLQDKGKQ